MPVGLDSEMPAPADGRIVGRAGELSRFDALVGQVTAGRGGLAWVHGEAGSGKSTLAGALAWRASQAGCQVFRGTGDELAQAFPLRLMADALGVSRRTPDENRARIARLLLGEAGDAAGVADPVLAASERLLELVDRLCADGPVVLMTEDLHWADEPSLLVWNRLARAVDQVPLLLVGTSRPVPRRATATLLRQVVRERHGELVTLGPLSAVDVGRIAEDILGAKPGPNLSIELERAGGNPLYVRELVEALHRDRSVTVDDGVAEFHGSTGATPGSLAVVIEQRLRFPHPETVRVLRIAALLGSGFNVDDLAVVSGKSAQDLSLVIEEAIAAGVVRAAGTRLVFRHELIRQVLVEQSSPAIRAALHHQFARDLAAAGRGVEVVAPHLLAGPSVTDRWASRWLVEVPETALYGVPQVAVDLLNRALRALDVEDPLWETLAARTAHVLFWLGRDEQAYRLAREVARRTGDATTEARMNALVLRSAGRLGRLDEVLTMARQPIDGRIPAACQAALGAWSTAVLAAAGETGPARAAARRAAEQAARTDDRLAIGYALHAAAVVSDAPSALRHIDGALAGLSTDPESMDLRLLLTNNRLTYLAILGRWEEAEACLAAALALAERAGTARGAWLLSTAAEVCYVRGAWDDALVHLRGIDSQYQGNVANLNPPAVGALIALHRGERGTAEAYLRVAEVTEPGAAGYARNPTNWRLTAAWALHAEANGDPRRAVALMTPWLDPVLVPGQQTRQEMMPHLVRVALSAGDRGTAEAAAAVCHADADGDHQPDQATAARCCQAQLDDDPEGLLAVAEEYRRSGRPLQLALAQEEAAVLLAGAGDLGQARTTFNAALRTYADLGAHWDTRRVEARLRPYGIRRGPRSPHRRATRGWESLTPAESRIAELVARGMSNPDIAAELFLSRRTVQTHVSNVLAKLGLSSRVEIMREAIDR